mmetsp:Transcript_36202/g.84849  ORF Transcript_36202/g.84849 Transcript_36202/m.84849 type:complete len:188 (+) Transcript_36202:1455-2018(+)
MQTEYPSFCNALATRIPSVPPQTTTSKDCIPVGDDFVSPRRTTCFGGSKSSPCAFRADRSVILCHTMSARRIPSREAFPPLPGAAVLVADSPADCRNESTFGGNAVRSAVFTAASLQLLRHLLRVPTKVERPKAVATQIEDEATAGEADLWLNLSRFCTWSPLPRPAGACSETADARQLGASMLLSV